VENRSDRLEDNRFKEIKRLKKKNVPHQLHWFLKDDYFSEELLGVYIFELQNYKQTSEEAFYLFEKATDKIIQNNDLEVLGIPSFFHECIIHSWNNRIKHPFLYGRFDINGGLGNNNAKIIEFNADTCTTIPETVVWQKLQHNELKGNSEQFNSLALEIGNTLTKLKSTINHSEPFILGSSFGYKEDILNVNCILDIAYDQGYKSFYVNLEEVIFSQEQGILYEINGEYQIADIWFKMIPWDWMFNEEPQLAKDLSVIITKNLCTVLNPAYTAIWQNKKFMAYITKHFPNNVIAETFSKKPLSESYVSKPCYGRLGESISIMGKINTSTKGDFSEQETIFQKYYPLAKDLENYYYQVGIFYSNNACALNLRSQESKIITDDCEFMSHYVI